MTFVFQEPESQNLDLSDDEELAQAMDFHSMIINSHHHDPEHVVTADEVISELETMMEVSTYWLSTYSMTPVSEMYQKLGAYCFVPSVWFNIGHNLF